MAAIVGSDDPTASQRCACEKCGATLQSVVLQSERCATCDGTAFRWWDRVEESWYQPDLRPTGVAGNEGVWLKGTFTGDLAGAQSGYSSTVSGLARVFQTPIRRGTIDNVQRVSGPPLGLEGGEKPPLREAAVVQVRVRYGEGNRLAAEVTLHDVRIHDWEVLGVQELASSEASLGHRAASAIRGTAYGFLPSSPSSVALAETGPDHVENRPPAEQPVDQPTQLPAPIQSALSSTFEPSGVQAPNASEQNPPDPAVVAPPAPLSGAGCWFCKRWVVVLLAIAFWLICDWKTAVLGVLASIFLACWLGERVPWKVRRERQVLAAAPILLAAAGAAILGFSQPHSGCEGLPVWPLALPLLGLAASVLFRPCWIRACLMALWLLALGLHCSTQYRDCRPATAPTPASTASAPAPAIPSVDNQEAQGFIGAAAGKVSELWSGLIDRLRQLLYFDSTAQALSQASEQLGENRLMSIDLALQKPEVLSDCKTAIYFPNTSMFELNSAIINRDVESQLMKLDKLRDKLPGRELRITGHADKVGADSPPGTLRNVELSEQRAAAVANWLIDRTGWKLEDLEAVGAGSKFPLIDKEGDVPLNRRVEIRLRCKPGSTK